jgi:replicative DNA helicase
VPDSDDRKDADVIPFDFGVNFEPATERLKTEFEERIRLSKRVIPFNVSYLDDFCLGIYPTDFAIISAATGAGKTTLGTLLAYMAAKQGRRVHFFALEAHRAEIEQRLLFRSVSDVARREGLPMRGVTFNRWMYGRCEQLYRVESEARDALAKEIGGLSTFYRASTFTHQDITKLFLAVKEQTDLIVLDHLHYIDMDGPHENAEMKRIVKAIRDTALDMEVPVVAIAHMRKKERGKPRMLPETDDIHGASDITKAATKVILIAPARQEGFESTDSGLAHTIMQVSKDRFAGINNLAALMKYDLNALSYQKMYAVVRVAFDGELSHINHNDVPGWAQNGIGLEGKDVK